MLMAISFQIVFPLLPLYSVGYMLGCELVRTFIVENEKEAYRDGLEDALYREQQQSQELKTAWELAYTDALTGVKNKLAYIEQEKKINDALADGSLSELALVVFDLNDLKTVNDTYGHVAGDRYITAACELIQEYFDNSSVFRVGGDEFTVILEGEDYSNRTKILASFYNRIITNAAAGDVVIAFGSSEYIWGKDDTCKQIVERADLLMYEQKAALKTLAVPYVNR